MCSVPLGHKDQQDRVQEKDLELRVSKVSKDRQAQGRDRVPKASKASKETSESLVFKASKASKET